jgi:hypothetical protein
MPFPQGQPFLLAGAGADQLGITQHVPHWHPSGPQPAQQHEPVEVGITEPAPPVRVRATRSSSPMRSYQRSVYWLSPHLSAASRVVQLVTRPRLDVRAHSSANPAAAGDRRAAQTGQASRR